MADDRERHAEQLLDVAADAARTVSTRLAAFFTVGVYVAVTIASTTDEMLVKRSLVTLPVLDTQIPISGWFGFYTVVPWLIVVLHLDCLLQLCTLAAKLQAFDAERRALDDGARRRLRARLPSLHHVQFFTVDGVSGLQRALSGIIVWSGLVAFPLVLLCAMQVRCLALHDGDVTTSHRLAVLADVALILAFFWQPLCLRRAADAQAADATGGTSQARCWMRPAVPALCALVLAFCVWAGIPGQRCAAGPWGTRRNLDLRGQVLTMTPMSAEAINGLRDGDVRRREAQLDKVSRQSFLQGRDLRCADFSNAVLPRVDLRSLRVGPGEDGLVVTKLGGADFRWAQMQQVLLDDADLRRAMLEGAQLQGGSFARANLEDAVLALAQLQDAKLPSARMSRASLRGAQLQGADLSDAVLHDVDLSGANLQGANLQGAQLQGADLTGASLAGADLSGTGLDGAQLRNAQWRGAFVDDTLVGVASASDATVERAALDGDWSRPVADGRPCEARARAAECPQAVVADLVELACADAYVARGLAMRALSTVRPDRACLLEALRTKADADPPCAGIALLPETTKRVLAAPPMAQSVLAAGPHQ